MPKYRITGPDGGTYEVTAPEGATQEQVLAYAQQNYKPQVGRSGVTREQRQADIARMDAEREARDAQIKAQTGRGRAANITGRSMLEGLAAIPDMFVAPLTDLVNRAGEKPRNLNSLITGEPERYFPKQMNLTQGVNYLADLIGGEQVRPETGGERVLADTARGLTGAVVPVGAGRQMAQSGNQVVNRIGQLLQQQPVAQIAGGGLSGAAQGATREAGGGTGAQLTAGFLGALAPFGPGALVRPNSTMVERSAMNQIRSEAADPSAIAFAERSRVPGVQRTLSEATLDPGLARLERQVRGRTSEFTPLDSANNAARVAQLQRIAGTDADMTAAVQARSDATNRLRDTAFNEADQIAEQAYQYGATPGGNVAGLRKQIIDLAGPQEGRDAVSRTFDAVLRDLDRAEPSAQGLYQVRKSINDMIEGKAGSERDYARAATAELMQIRNMVDSELANLAPSFEAYRGAFQNMSRPINRMEVGRELMNRGSGSVADPTTGLRPLLPASLSKQAVDLDALAKRATGFDKARAADILTPDDISAIRAIQDDLERQNFRATAGSGGNSMTAERQALGERLGRSALEAIPVVGGFAERLRMLNQPRIDAAIARLIADPLEARRVLESMAPRDRQVITKAMIQMSAARPKER
jgi:hypothetical protein